MFQRILIANRGEIAVRIIRACRELGISPVAVYSEADATALHVRLADEAILIGPAAAAQSYLRGEAIIAAAQATGAEAIHPGYGFLAENAAFARQCAEADIVFIGPPPAAIEAMGGKIGARAIARQAGVPVVPGYDGVDQSVERLLSEADQIGYPLLIKASAGGGGKGMRIVQSAGELPAALAGAQREALAAFGDAAVFIERYVQRPRHIEIQVFADAHGTVVHLGERDCSIQRRHQKILEESPAPGLSAELRAEMGAAAVRLARAAGYVNAGTVEFVLGSSPAPVSAADHGPAWHAQPYYFLEMNTRLQVEHPVTELVSGRDLVHLQIAVAAGARLPFTQEQVALRGHAIEARLYAEDPVHFLPAIGRLELVELPHGPGVRSDSGLTGGDDVTVHYDPMIAKLIVYGADRAAAVARLGRALDETTILGLTTNLPLLRAITHHPAFGAGAVHTGFLAEHPLAVEPPQETPIAVLAAAALRALGQPAPMSSHDPFAAAWRAGALGIPLQFAANGRTHRIQADKTVAGWQLVIDDETYLADKLTDSPTEMVIRLADERARLRIAQDQAGDLLLAYAGHTYRLSRPQPLSADSLHRHGGELGDAGLLAPMPGTLVQVLVQEGDLVEEGQALVVLEAMKMEHTITAPYAGRVRRLPFAAGSSVAGGAALAELEASDTA